MAPGIVPIDGVHQDSRDLLSVCSSIHTMVPGSRECCSPTESEEFLHSDWIAAMYLDVPTREEVAHDSA
jgi:hypothetical protein